MNMKPALLLKLIIGLVVVSVIVLIAILLPRPKAPAPPQAFNWDEVRYIQRTDWPPHVAAIAGPYSCFEAGTPEARAGRTEQRIINGTPYCVTEVAEGAAGSVYRQYAYATSHNNQVLIFTLGLRFVQCANYDELEQQLCEQERASFNLDPIVDAFAQTYKTTTR